MWDFNEYQRGQPFKKSGSYAYRVMPRVVCADGFEMSVQASSTHYCTPRENEEPYYSTVEVGYPSQVVPELLPYIDGSDGNPTESVYGGVPVDVVNRIVAAHGGPK
jgi:hypothetical protein